MVTFAPVTDYKEAILLCDAGMLYLQDIDDGEMALLPTNMNSYDVWWYGSRGRLFVQLED